MKPHCTYDLDWLPKPRTRRRLPSPRLVTAAGLILTVWAAARTEPGEHPRVVFTGAPPAWVVSAPRLAVSIDGAMVVTAPVGIDDRMVHPAPIGIDDAMVVNAAEESR